MKKIKLIYVCTDNIGPVLEGQVYNLLEYLQQFDVFREIVILQQYSSHEILEKVQEALQKYGFRKVYFKANLRNPSKYFETCKNLKAVLASEMTEDSVIHVRSNLMSPIVRRALPKAYKDAYILTEFRGLTIDEIKMVNKGSWVYDLYVNLIKVPYAKWLTRRLYNDKLLHITAVSPNFKEIIEKEGVPQECICVHPNIVSPDFVFNEAYRNEIRKQYGIPNDKKVAILSSGVGNAWQGDEIVIDRLLDLGFVIFNLGKNKTKREGVINGFYPRSEMPKYLSAADVAVLWREDIPLNNVACPSKFGEFVTMGLYVIHNGTVDIAKHFIEDNDAGIIVNAPEEIKIDMSKLDLEVRKNRCAVGYNMFSVECIAKSYISHYINKN